MATGSGAGSEEDAYACHKHWRLESSCVVYSMRDDGFRSGVEGATVSRTVEDG